MDLDLVSNGTAIKNSVNSFNVGNISWIVFGYTNNRTINVIETGGDSLEDMFEEFDSNKIMYGFASVIDPNSKLKKNVFIHWQGEAATQAMKTKSVQHANIIRDLCKPVHVTHHARDEQDLDLKEIMVKVASASGSNYSYHNETKQYQNDTTVKSDENTAQNIRQNRLKELSGLSNLQKESVPEQRIILEKHVKQNLQGSTYEKVNPAKELQNLRTKAPETNYPPKPNYTKIDAAKEIKSHVQDQTRVPHQTVGTNYVKIDASKEIKLSSTNVPVSQNLTSGYKKINPELEFKSLNLNQKTMFESQAKVKSENNTAEKAKEERQKELSNLFNKKIAYDDEADRRVGTNYTRVNPVAEIKKLRSASITQECVDAPSSPMSTYKKIDPATEIQNIRRLSSSIPDEPVSPGTNYKKINPSEEIKKLRSQSTFEDVKATTKSYKKIDPAEEINYSRKLSSSFIKADSETKVVTPSVNIAPKAALSARQTLENVHKTHGDVQQTHRTQVTKDQSQQDWKKLESNTQKVEPSKSSLISVKQTQPIVEVVKTEPKIVKDTPPTNNLKNTAEAQFQYDAADIDEISFDEGEIIRDIEVIDDDWWMGVNAAGKKGLFPSNYVMPHNVEQMKKDDHRVVAEEPQSKQNDIHRNTNGVTSNNSALAAVTTDTIPSSIVSERHSDIEKSSDLTAIATFDYDANDNDEISFAAGEIIKEIEKIDDGWWIGVNVAGVRGMFPSNFVDLQWNDQDSAVVNVNESKDVGICEQQRTSVADTLTVRAIYDYDAQGDDELSFNTGDVITNVAMIDDGWWEGDSSSGQRGLFPANYVETV